jgi:hypothetical protein
MDESKRAGLKHAPTTLNSFFFLCPPSIRTWKVLVDLTYGVASKKNKIPIHKSSL